MKALYWSAVVNGVLAPFLLVGMLFVALDKKIMQNQTGSLLGKLVVIFTALLMFLAAGAMFYFL